MSRALKFRALKFRASGVRALRWPGLVLSLGVGLGHAAPDAARAQGAPDAARPEGPRAPVILGAPGTPPSAEIVDESGLRYYAAQRQAERVQAEIARLRRRYPNWSVPTDLDTLKPSPPEEAPLWDLFTAGRVAEVRAMIAARQAADPDWRPSEDLARKLNRGTLRGEVKAAEARGDWEAIRARVRAKPDALRDLDIDIAWTVAEAYARTGDTEQAAEAYRTILSGLTETALRLATVQKAMSALPIAQVEPLLGLGQPGADGGNEFQALRLDVTRARIAAALRGEPGGRIEPADLAALSAAARRADEPGGLSLLGWYAYHRRQFREALDWFKAAIARGGDARIATGLALALREVGQEREAEEVAYAWRGPSVSNAALYLDMVGRRLTQGGGQAPDPARLDRFAKLVLATSSGEGAQALGWYAYNACQFEAAADWFQRAAAWKPQEAAVLGYALALTRVKRPRDALEVVNRFDGLFPTVVELALPAPEGQPGPCDPAPEPLAGPPIPQGRAPKPVPAVAPAHALPVKRGVFPVAVAAENPLRFPELAERAREGDYLREPRAAQPLVARRVPGIGTMPYERYGFALLPAWNGLDRAAPQAALPTPPVGTLAHAEAAAVALGGPARLAQAHDGDRFGPFDTAAGRSRLDPRTGGQDR